MVLAGSVESTQSIKNKNCDEKRENIKQVNNSSNNKNLNIFIIKRKIMSSASFIHLASSYTIKEW